MSVLPLERDMPAAEIDVSQVPKVDMNWSARCETASKNERIKTLIELARMTDRDLIIVSTSSRPRMSRVRVWLRSK